MQGFLSGTIWGTVASGIGLSVLSLTAPLAPRPDLAEAPAEAAATAPDTTAQSGVGGSGARDARVVEAAPVVPDPATAGGAREAMAEADTDPGALPQAGAATAALDEPVSPAEDAGAAPGADNPVAQGTPVPAPEASGSETVARADLDPGRIPDVNPQTRDLSTPADGNSLQPPAVEDSPVQAMAPGAAPELPEGESALALSIGDPQQPQLPEVSETGSGFASGPVSETAPEVQAAADPQIETGSGAGVDVPSAGEVPMPSTDSTGAPEPAQAPLLVAAVDPDIQRPEPPFGSAPAPQPTRTIAPRSTPQQSVEEPEADTTPAEEPVAIATTEASVPRVRSLPGAGTTEAETTAALVPTVGKRVVPLTERKQTAPVEGDEAQQAAAPSGPPLEAYATSFENPEGKPLMSIVLIDDEGALGAEALADFPYPLTFAIDPTAPGAAEKMARHRAAGFEVMAFVDLPEQAAASDAEVSLASVFRTLPEALGVLEGTGSGVQGNRELAGQVAAFSDGTGRGVVFQAKGLNTAQKLAQRDGVPSAVVFRDFDGAGQAPVVMRRFLDQAAFRARQEGGVIMLGRVRPDTISALLLWGLQDRADQVALAPVSAVLKSSVVTGTN